MASAVLEDDEGRMVEIMMTSSSSSIVHSTKEGDILLLWARDPSSASQIKHHCIVNSQVSLELLHGVTAPFITKDNSALFDKMHLEYRLLKESMPRW